MSLHIIGLCSWRIARIFQPDIKISVALLLVGNTFEKLQIRKRIDVLHIEVTISFWYSSAS